MASQKRTVQQEIREAAQAPSTTLCRIYTGLLGDGRKSPGFLASYGSGKYPAAYVVSYVEWDQRNVRSPLSPETPGDDPDIEMRWAADHVRVIRLDMGRSILWVDPDLWDVEVVGPWRGSTYGRLRLKPGSVHENAVPEGKTMSQLRDESLEDRNLVTGGRMTQARGMFFTDKGDPLGPSGAKEPQFPAEGDHWV